MRAQAVLGEQPVVELARVANRRRYLAGTVPRNVVELDRLLRRAKTVATNLERVEHRLVADLVADQLVQRAAVRMADALLFGLHRREAGEVARGTLRVNVLPVFECPIQAGDHRDILGVLLERLHRGRPLEVVNTRLVLVPPLLLGLVGVESTDEARELRLAFPWEKLPSHDPVGDVHDHQFLVRLGQALGRHGSGRRVQHRQQHCRAASLQKRTSCYFVWTQHGKPPVNRHSGLKTPFCKRFFIDVAG